MLELLQTELINHILSYLEQDAVLQLAYVSRRLYVKALPAFYFQVTLKSGPTAQSKLTIPLFLRTISEYPVRAEQVRKIAFLGNPAPRNAQCVEGDDHRSWRALPWALPASRMVDRALVTVILQGLPNIRDVTIGFRLLLGLWTPTLPIDKIDRRCPMFSACTTPRTLKYITIAPDLDNEGRSLCQYAWDEYKYQERSPDAIFSYVPLSSQLFAGLLELPGLESLDILLPSTFSEARLSNIPPVSSLTSLSLRSTSCDERDLYKILSRTPRLQYLRYQRFYDPWEIPQRIPNPSALGEAINTVKETLISLVLEIEIMERANLGFQQEPEELDYQGPYKPIGDLRKFTKLRNLEIPIEILCGDCRDLDLSGVLPQGLITLSLRNDLGCFKGPYPWDCRNIVVMITSWIEQGTDRSCNVTHLELALHQERFFCSDEDVTYVQKELLPLLYTAGIDLQIRLLKNKSYSRGIDWKRIHVPYEL